jgi:2,3-bisphosphoglycerate-dependent phosphoglycerate mutase
MPCPLHRLALGMTDTPLTADGVMEARTAGKLMAEMRVEIDEVYTSLLRRSTKTVWLCMQEMQQEWVPVYKKWRLNERNYGALVGMNKKECVAKHGADQVRRWRRSWDEPPPPMSRHSRFWPGKDPRYKMLGITDDMIPASESLKQVVERTKPFWTETIVPRLRLGKKLLIVGHENNLRSILKVLDCIPEEDVINVDIPRGIPLVYTLDPVTLLPIGNRDKETLLTGRYLGAKDVIKDLQERDRMQVYDLNVKHNLETVSLASSCLRGTYMICFVRNVYMFIWHMCL